MRLEVAGVDRPRAPRRRAGGARILPGRRQLVVERVPDQRVAEAQAPGDAGRRRGSARPAPRRGRRAASSRGSSLSRISASSSNSRPITDAVTSTLAARLRQPLHTLPDDDAHARRDAQMRVGVGDPPLAVEQAHDLADEQRVALGLGVDRGREPRCGLDAGARARYTAATSGSLEARERDVRRLRLAHELGQRRAQRRRRASGRRRGTRRSRAADGRRARGRRTAAAAATARRRRAGRRASATSGCACGDAPQEAGRRLEQPEARALGVRRRRLAGDRGRARAARAAAARDRLRRARAARAARPGRRCGCTRRSACTHGQYAGAPPASQQRPTRTCAPPSRARSSSSSASRLLPMPGSPASSTRRPWPASASSSAPSSCSSSRRARRSRTTERVVGQPGSATASSDASWARIALLELAQLAPGLDPELLDQHARVCR